MLADVQQIIAEQAVCKGMVAKACSGVESEALGGNPISQKGSINFMLTIVIFVPLFSEEFTKQFCKDMNYFLQSLIMILIKSLVGNFKPFQQKKKWVWLYVYSLVFLQVLMVTQWWLQL